MWQTQTIGFSIFFFLTNNLHKWEWNWRCAQMNACNTNSEMANYVSWDTNKPNRIYWWTKQMKKQRISNSHTQPTIVFFSLLFVDSFFTCSKRLNKFFTWKLNRDFIAVTTQDTTVTHFQLSEVDDNIANEQWICLKYVHQFFVEYSSCPQIAIVLCSFSFNNYHTWTKENTRIRSFDHSTILLTAALAIPSCLIIATNPAHGMTHATVSAFIQFTIQHHLNNYYAPFSLTSATKKIKQIDLDRFWNKTDYADYSHPNWFRFWDYFSSVLCSHFFQL